MKKFTTKMSIILCALFFGISFNFSVSGQINKTFTPVKKGIFEKIHQKNKLVYSNLKTEAIPQFYKSTNNTYPQEIHHFYWDVTTIWMATGSAKRSTWPARRRLCPARSVRGSTCTTATANFALYVPPVS